MKAFVWDKHFLTGLSTVDNQHEKLVSLVNDFGTALSVNNLDPAYLQQIIFSLAEYTATHFKDEEELMKARKIDSRHLRLHISQHRNFVNEINTLSNELADEKKQRTDFLFEYLVNWLIYHILGADQNMARQLQSITAGKSPQEAYEKEEAEMGKATQSLLVALFGLFELVAERNTELKELNRSLEKRVEERTRELSRANATLQIISVTDPLTNLPNRRYAMQQLTILFKESRSDNTPLCCLMIDADQFKEVNDTHGHDAGDAVLCSLARALQHSVRSDDILARIGGDEFLIICPKTDFNGAYQLAEYLREKVAQLAVPAGSGTWHGSISVGIGCNQPHIDDIDALIKAADRGVYLAKRDGRNCVRFTAD